jgi:hypothetical protein
MNRLKLFKLVCALGLLAVLASNVGTISHWNESRGVYDDVCYLRQAHLFQKHGFRGIDTNTTFDDDRYFADKLKAIGFAEWNDVSRFPCHTLIPAANKYVLQYPPGTGFALALFPGAFQVIPLYVMANVTVLGFALLGLLRARGPAALALAALFGFAALYLMINPTKASYSIAPTMMVCAAAGWLTARFLAVEPLHRLVPIVLVGLLLGLSVNFRLANLFLAAGYCLYLAGASLLARSRETFLQGLSFGIALLIGMTPTLIANAINAGSPFATTYGSDDAVPPAFDAGILWQYIKDMQFVLLVIAGVWTALLGRFGHASGARAAAYLVGGNLVLNLLFFMTHPVFTPYYTIPIAMLSLWTLLFATLGPRGEAAADNLAAPRPAHA